MEGIVYVISDYEGYYKIGCTKGELDKRIKHLSTSYHDDFFVVFYYISDYPFKLERYLHKYFFNKKFKGEWFLLDDSDIFILKSLCERYENNFKYIKLNNTYLYNDNTNR